MNINHSPSTKKSIGFRVFVFLGFLAFFSSLSNITKAQSVGESCLAAEEGKSACHRNGCFKCTSLVWTPQPLIFGSTDISFSCTSITAGTIQWTGSALEYCNGTAWEALTAGGGGSNTPSAINFTNQTDVLLDSDIISNAVILSGFSGVLSARCGTGCTGLSVNGRAWEDSSNISSGDTLAIRQISSSELSTTAQAQVTVGATTSSAWSVSTTSTSDPCAVASPAVGTVCSDGSVYIGITPDGSSKKMFATRCDYGQIWNGSACTGTRIKLAFSTGQIVAYLTNVNNLNTGQINTQALYDKGIELPGAPHEAARACYALVENNKMDWYLPAVNEIKMVWTGSGSTSAGVTTKFGGTFLTTAGEYYGSSSENSTNQLVGYFYSAGSSSISSKAITTNIRCFRKQR